MTWIRTISEEEATGPLKELYDRLAARMGRVGNIVKACSLRPQVLIDQQAFTRGVTFGGSPLGRRKEELIATMISGLLKCRY
ncbi:MAG TPA: peroxidase [Chloroflexota bacterium]|nr:peroxidase [Chloroflexota bacterium]